MDSSDFVVKIKSVQSSTTKGIAQPNTKHNIAEDFKLQQHHYENLKSRIFTAVC